MIVFFFVALDSTWYSERMRCLTFPSGFDFYREKSVTKSQVKTMATSIKTTMIYIWGVSDVSRNCLSFSRIRTRHLQRRLQSLNTLGHTIIKYAANASKTLVARCMKKGILISSIQWFFHFWNENRPKPLIDCCEPFRTVWDKTMTKRGWKRFKNERNTVYIKTIYERSFTYLNDHVIDCIFTSVLVLVV